jgi:hypothetical protein
MPSGKVITTLRDRPAIEATLETLARARTEPETETPLRALRRYGSAVLLAVVGLLDTPDPWMVRALGRALTQLQDRKQAAAALRRAILDPASSDRRRIVAMVLLDQFLQQPLDENLFSALGSPTEVAVNALLRELPAEERLTRLDYLSIIHVQQPADIHAALGRFAATGSDSAIAALVFFALDEREDIALMAVDALGTIRRPAALHALRIIAWNMAAARRPFVERMQRKLLLGGVPDEPLPEPPAGARVLLSAVDGAGNRLMLFLFPLGEGYRGLHLFMDDEQGIRGAYELDYAPGELPPPAPAGTVHPAPHPWKGVLLLEGTWGYARRLLQQALSYNEDQETLTPVDYRFFCDQVWGWSAPPDEKPALPDWRETDWPQAITSLLGTPYLASWFLESERIYQVAAGLLVADPAPQADQERLTRVIQDLLSAECPPEICEQYAARLRDMAEWLLRAGEIRWAAIAHAGAVELDRVGVGSAFARAMLQKGLLFAATSMGREEGVAL